MSERIRLDLNFPEFQAQLFDLDKEELKLLFKALKKLSVMTWKEIHADKGLKWEEIKSDKGSYSIRLSSKYRAVVTRVGNVMCFKALHPDHDDAYGKR